MDCIDRAQDRERIDRELALSALRDKHASAVASPDGCCVDCGDLIEPARMRALSGLASRCLSCAEDHELRQRRHR